MQRPSGSAGTTAMTTTATAAAAGAGLGLPPMTATGAVLRWSPLSTGVRGDLAIMESVDGGWGGPKHFFVFVDF